jgi:hypothetical protein
MNKKQRPFWDMTAGDGGPAIKPPARELARLRQARRKGRGRPIIGKGARRVSVSIERTRLKDIDRLARKLGLSRSEFIANAVEKELAGIR